MNVQRLLVRAIAAACVAASGCSGTSTLDGVFETAAALPHLDGLTIQRAGATVREQYFRGRTAADPQDVRSVTKSVTSLLVGIALERGCLHSIDQTLGELLGDRAPADPAKAAVTLRNLLSMSSGFEWSEVGNIGDYDPWASAPDQVAYLLARPLVAQPGTVFNYNSAGFHLASVALSSACAPTATFAQQTLFAALGIPARSWETDKQGTTNGAAGLQLTIPEMVAIGDLVLAGGKVGTQQVVPAAWVQAATSAQIATGPGGYGYGFWTGVTDTGDGFIASEGFGGQFIFEVPHMATVVAAASDWRGLGSATGPDFDQLWALIIHRVLTID